MKTKHGLQVILNISGGDDWNDVHYECNAGLPYDHWSELIEDNEDMFKIKFEHHPIELKELYFEIDYWNYEPCSYYSNSPYSVEAINKGAVPWIHTDDFNIQAGTTIDEFIKIIKEHGGKIFLEDK